MTAWVFLAVLAIASATCPAQSPVWAPVTVSSRSGHAIAYDSARGVTVLFGGLTDNTYNGETWEWNGTAWTLRSTAGPVGRRLHAMAYDSVRGVIVMFGGVVSSAGSLSNETWEWDGHVWTLRATTGPSARANHAMAFDAVRGVTVLFGAESNDDGWTWEWNGAVWAQRAHNATPSRYGHAMAYDSVRHVVVMFGGNNQGSDTLEWNGTAWTQRAVSGPTARWSHGLAFDSARGVAVLFGGLASGSVGGFLGDTWEWNGTAWTQRTTSGPIARSSARLVFDSTRGRCMLFGGAGTNASPTPTLGDTWEWSGTAWTMRADCPLPRRAHAMAFDSARGVGVMMGGEDMNETPNGETWEWSTSGWALRSVGGPSARSWHSMCYDSARGVTVLFGGFPGGNETWEWNGTMWTQRLVAGPSSRRQFGMSYDSARHVTVVFGGDANGLDNAETWEWDGGSWTQRVVPGPSARSGPSMAFDPVRGVSVLFGGSSGAGETWEWDGVSWTERATTGPGSGYSQSLAFDAARGVVVMLLPDFSFTSRTWEWNGVTGVWTQRSIPGPPGRDAATMVYNTVRDEVEVLGGQINTALSSSLWGLGHGCSGPSVSIQPSPGAACAGHSAHFSVTAPGATWYEWQVQTGASTWLPLRSTPALMPCGGSVSAPNAASVSITLGPCAGNNRYQVRCVAANSCGWVASNPATLTINSGDFNGDGDTATDADIEAFFRCLAGNCCATCGSADFNGDGDAATDADIEAFFRVIAGGAC